MSDSAESDTQVGAEAAGMSVSPESDIPASAEASGPNPPNPSVPWNCAQPASGMNDAAQDGCDDPRITGTCWSPNRSSTYCVLRTAFPIATLPYVPTTPSRLTSSKVARYAKAKASSMPVSTSRISLRSFMGSSDCMVMHSLYRIDAVEDVPNMQCYHACSKRVPHIRHEGACRYLLQEFVGGEILGLWSLVNHLVV